jgi:hypothetical protein
VARPAARGADGETRRPLREAIRGGYDWHFNQDDTEAANSADRDVELEARCWVPAANAASRKKRNTPGSQRGGRVEGPENTRTNGRLQQFSWRQPEWLAYHSLAGLDSFKQGYLCIGT